jgi:hypothetical protein
MRFQKYESVHSVPSGIAYQISFQLLYRAVLGVINQVVI